MNSDILLRGKNSSKTSLFTLRQKLDRKVAENEGLMEEVKSLMIETERMAEENIKFGRYHYWKRVNSMIMFY